MDMRRFCNTLGIELSSWRSKLYDIISHVETLPPLDRQHVAPDVNALRALIGEIDDSLREMRTECPVSFGVQDKSPLERTGP